MAPETSSVQRHFDHVPKQWDAFYSHENRFIHLINRLLRKGLYERYRLTFENCGDLSGARVLDIGCGTGRYSVECAKRGASRIVGIDFTSSMIDFSRKIAQQMDVADKCEFICGDLLIYSFDETFDVVLALGFFDYIKNPELIFKKVAQLNPSKFLASFPKFTPIWGYKGSFVTITSKNVLFITTHSRSLNVCIQKHRSSITVLFRVAKASLE